MSTWVTIPSARPVAEVNAWAAKWIAMGYRVAIQRDPGKGEGLENIGWYERPYAGYAEAVNFLVKAILAIDTDCDWIVIGGDDVFPDPTKRADEIAWECNVRHVEHGTFSVMQPTGDRWGDTPQSRQQYGEHRGAYIDRVAGSPWIGREFALRVNQGNGPLWPEYSHMGVDEELQAVAEKLGVFWQRPDLTHLHQHWGRPREGERFAQRDRMPAFLERANSPEEWARYKRIFGARKLTGFPGSEVL